MTPSLGRRTMLENIANESRKNIMKMIYNAKSGHPGGSLSCIDILTYLYHQEMHLNQDNINSCDRNRLVLSKGHGAPALYATLNSLDFLTQEDLKTFRKINSRLQGHPNMNDVAGIDMSTGSLGQGLSAAVGMALANKIKGNDYYVFVICGDGECEEGQIYEALMAASHYQLHHLIIYLDYNGLQIDGKIQDVMNPEPFEDKFKAFGFEVIHINGHDFDEIAASTMKAKTSQQPTVIIAHTIKGKGISFMEDDVNWHGKAPNEEEYKCALKELERKEVDQTW